MMSCEAGHEVSMSEGNAKTSLEQSPMRESPRPMGLHKSTVTTQGYPFNPFNPSKSVFKKKESEALRCLEGTTMSNRGQRPRTTNAQYMTLPGGQYPAGQEAPVEGNRQ